MKRDEHISEIILFVEQLLGGKLLPNGETVLILGLWALLDDAIEDEAKTLPSMYERAKQVSMN